MAERLFAPGKMFLAGEYAVLLPEHAAVIAAINRGVWVSISEENEEGFVITLEDFGLAAIEARLSANFSLEFQTPLLSEDERKLQFTKVAIETTYRYLYSSGKLKGDLIRGVKLTTSSNLNLQIDAEKKEKYGLGSSAASTVAIIASILSIHGFSLETSEEKLLLYKLAAIAHYHASGTIGSCGDIAASVYGGLILYSRFDPEWLTQAITENQELITIINTDWTKKGLQIEPLLYSNNLHFLVGWTKKSCSTRAMIKKFKEWYQRDKESTVICKKIAAAARAFAQGLITKNWTKIKTALTTNRKQILLLEQRANFTIETPPLQLLAEIAERNDGAGKFSGAGGGDCGFAFVPTEEGKKNILKEWIENGIKPLEIDFDLQGVRYADRTRNTTTNE
ncbi:MAG: phosphomevalonate kinase [Candidatus Heimdallarchaeota archaeon]|nr:phosphomevalonate kinase [Candidatus Heimdallarchaeota archaeon]